MSIFEKLKTQTLLGLIRDPRLVGLVTKREFRITEEDIRREIAGRAADDELQELEVAVREGFVEVSGRVRKRMVPFTIPFSARFSLHSLEFSHRNKDVHLKLEELKPLDLDWLTRRLVEKISFLSFDNSLVTLHLTKIPRLARLFAYDVKGFRPFDHIVVKDISFHDRQVVGHVGVML